MQQQCQDGGASLHSVLLKYHLVNKNIQVATYVKRARNRPCTFGMFHQHLRSY